MKLKKTSTFDTNLVEWEDTKFCILSTGEMVVFGKPSVESDPVINIYVDTGELSRTLRLPCQHNSDIGILPVVIDGCEYLAMSCIDCQEIFLRSLDSTKHSSARTVSAYKNKTWHYPGCMYQNEAGILFVENCVKRGEPVLLLDLSSTSFKFQSKISNSGMGCMFDMCYLYHEEKELLVLTDREPTAVGAVDVKSGVLYWKHTGEVEGSTCDPHGVCTTTAGNIIVADGKNSRILVLSPTGHVLQTIALSECGVAGHCVLRNEGKQLVLQHTYKHKVQISLFELS